MAFVAGAGAAETTAAVASPAEAAGAQEALAAGGAGAQRPSSTVIPASMTGGIIAFVIGYALIYWGWHHMPGQPRYSLWYLLGFGSLFGKQVTPGTPVQLGTPTQPTQPGTPTPSSSSPGTPLAAPPAARVNPGYPPDLPPAQTRKNNSPWWAYPPKGSKIATTSSSAGNTRVATSPKKNMWVQASGLPGGVGSQGLAWYNAGAI
jgi:hypothetical protein